MRFRRKNFKDQERRELYKQTEVKKNLYKMLRRNELVDNETRSYYDSQLQIFEKNSSISRIKNRCIMTGRPRGIIAAYKISRIQFKEYIRLGLIGGIRKLSY